MVKMYRSKGMKTPFFKLTANYTLNDNENVLGELLGTHIESSAIIHPDVKDGGKFEFLLHELETSLNIYFGRVFQGIKNGVEGCDLETDSPIYDYPVVKFFFGENVTVEEYNRQVSLVKSILEFDGEDTSDSYPFEYTQEELDAFGELILIACKMPKGLEKLNGGFRAIASVEYVDDRGVEHSVCFYNEDAVTDKQPLVIS